MRSLVLALLVACFGSPIYSASFDKVSGDYIEARSNHVYTCGCLYSGELVTSGREAIVAWNIKNGQLGGFSVDNVRVVAVLMGATTLSLGESPRKSVLYFDGLSGPEQRKVIDNWLKTEYSDLLGDTIATYEAPIQFTKSEGKTAVSVGEDVRIELRNTRLPEDAHLGSYLWYDPFVPVEQKQLSTVLLDEYSGRDFGMTWRRWEHRIAGYQARFSTQ